MKNMKKVLRTAKAKVLSYYSYGSRDYYAYLQPTEFLLLLGEGIVAKDDDIDNARYKQKYGISSPQWYYFQLGSMQLDQKE